MVDWLVLWGVSQAVGVLVYPILQDLAKEGAKDFAKDFFAFMHRTFLEYFCAWEFVWQFKETQTVTIEQLKTEVFGKHWQDESWHEMLRLISGMLEAKFTSEIIEYLIAQKKLENWS